MRQSAYAPTVETMLRRAAIFVATAALAALPALAAAPAPASAAARYERGFDILMYRNAHDVGPRSAVLFRRLAKRHVTHVRIVFPIVQASATGSRVYRSGSLTPPDAYLKAMTRQARRRHMAVTLVPAIDDARLGPDYWRGTIKPVDRAAWFASYGAVMRHYARLARSIRAASLSVGIELESMSAYNREWTELVRSVRRVFHGRVTYSVNWSSISEGRHPAWLAKLDSIGLDSYFPLDVASQPTIADLLGALGARWASPLATFRAAYPGRRVVITEVGVRSEMGAAHSPYRWDNHTTVDLEGQRRYYAAYCSWARANHLGGIYWWFADLNVPRGPVSDRTYNPLGKPAEQQVARCFG